MKKICMILAAAAALASAACNKIENPNAEGKGINILLSVADYSTSPDTKAVKTSWTSGDKINIWFDGASVATPHLVITYDGTKWTPGALDATVEAALKKDGTGTFKYVYEGGNDISAFTNTYGWLFAFPEGKIEKFCILL